MRIRAPSLLSKLFASRVLLVLPGAALLTLTAAVFGCFGDDGDDEPAATGASGSVATATATEAASAAASSTPVRAGGTLIPLSTATPAPSATPAGSGALPPLQTVSMIDMAPCSDATYFEEQNLSARVPALTYKDVPVGTPILFPFEAGRLLEADARRGAISLSFEVEGVGILTVLGAGSSSLDRSLDEVVKGSVIGHFGGVFDDEASEAFEGYQMFAVLGDTVMVQIGDTFYAGQAIDPNVTDCLVLP